MPREPGGWDRIRYSAEQLATIRAAIARLPRLAPEEAAARNEAVAAGRCPRRLWPLWPIAGADAGLWRLLAEDEKIAEFSVYGLFPAAYEIVYGGHCAGRPGNGAL